MIEIEYKEVLDDELGDLLGIEFEKYAKKNNIVCDYTPFNFVAKENGKVIGMITGHSYYKEVHIGDLIVLEEYRNKHIGTKLIANVEEYYKNKGFENMNLTTYAFQAPDFYKKNGFEVEFVRESKSNPKLNKYFLVKYF